MVNQYCFTKPTSRLHQVGIRSTFIRLIDRVRIVRAREDDDRYGPYCRLTVRTVVPMSLVTQRRGLLLGCSR